MRQTLFPIAAALVVAGCQAAPYRPYPSQPYQPHSPYPPQQIGCPIVSSSNWAGWINAMPGPNARPSLIVTGKVTVPTGGYRFAWRDMRVMEGYPVQVSIDLEPVPPTGGATQAIVTHDVRGQWPMSPPVGSVTIRCGGQTLAVISPVETAR
ncbi:MAG: hypothetical protein WKF52_08510 [Sphingomicrobium sp.]